MSSEFPVNFELDKHLYIPICTDAEIRRIWVVKNSEDYLLKLRADTAYLIVRIWNATLPKFIDKKKAPETITVFGASLLFVGWGKGPRLRFARLRCPSSGW